MTDLEQFVDLALELRDYALAIDFSRTIIQIMPNYKKYARVNQKLFEVFQRVEEMKISLAKLNNAFHMKGKAFIGTGSAISHWFFSFGF